MLLDRFDLVENGDFLTIEAENDGYKVTIKKNFNTILEKHFSDSVEAVQYYKKECYRRALCSIAVNA